MVADSAESPVERWLPGVYLLGPASCASAAKARALELFGQRWVLFRDRRGQPALLRDRCPHRGLPLSKGSLHPSGLRCAYHGWCFASDGRCVEVPGRSGLASPARVEALPLLERQDLLWVSWADGVPAAPELEAAAVPRLREIDDASYVHATLTYDAPAGLPEVAENILDLPHTAFVHGGLFRRQGHSRPIEAELRAIDTGLELRYQGEPAPTGLMGNLLVPRRERRRPLEHWDRFHLPALAEVDYGLGSDRRIVARHYLLPISTRQTRATLVIAARLPVPAVALSLALHTLGRAILHQDRRILALQSQSLAAQPRQPLASTELDTLGLALRQLLRHPERVGRLPQAPKRYQIL